MYGRHILVEMQFGGLLALKVLLLLYDWVQYGLFFGGDLLSEWHRIGIFF
jgi:hypothetical protein